MSIVSFISGLRSAKDRDEEEIAECPACGETSIPIPAGFGILFRTARCNACDETFGKWRNFADEDFEVTLRTIVG